VLTVPNGPGKGPIGAGSVAQIATGAMLSRERVAELEEGAGAAEQLWVPALLGAAEQRRHPERDRVMDEDDSEGLGDRLVVERERADEALLR